MDLRSTWSHTRRMAARGTERRVLVPMRPTMDEHGVRLLRRSASQHSSRCGVVEMESGMTLAERLQWKYGLWGTCLMPCDTDDKWNSVAAEALAHVREVLRRDSLAEMLHKTWANGVSTWEDDKIIQPAFYRQADAILMLLDAAGKS